MRVSPNGLKLIQVFESLGDGNKKTPDFEPYPCLANIYTVGWGHVLLTPSGAQIDIDHFGASAALQLAREAMQRVFGKQAITRAEADALLDRDLDSRETGVAKAVGTSVTQDEFDALVSLTFNIGLANFNTSTVKKLHVAGKRQIGAIDLDELCAKSKAKALPVTLPIAFVRWVNVSGKWSLGLFRRRAAEMIVYSGWDAQEAYDLVMQFRD